MSEAARAAWQLRPGRPSDAADLLRVHARAVAGADAYSAEARASWAFGNDVRRYERELADPSLAFLIAVIESETVGFAAWSAGELKSLYVDPTHGGRGVGSALLRAAETAMTAAGHQELVIDATLSGLSLYRRFGYVERSRRESPSRGGLEMTTVTMSKTV